MFLENSKNMGVQSSRVFALKEWLESVFDQGQIELTRLAGDASFRCYYRFSLNGHCKIALDAPTDKSNNQGFIALQQMLNDQSVLVPEILAVNEEQGFFCLSDLGDLLLADVLTPENMQQYYRHAIEVLTRIHSSPTSKSYKLPVFNRDFILTELEIFTQWLLHEHLQLELTAGDEEQLSKCFNMLIDSALSQPQVVMHRDYHSRNIMMLADNQLAIIDFQDAVIGPITYDIVSLLRDCYIRWPDEAISPLFDYFRKQIAKYMGLTDISDEQWQRWFDLMGLQRHIKASGIFARLYHRDGKKGYLKDIPLTLSYIQDVAASYPELNFLNELVTFRVLPALNKKIQAQA